MHAPLSHAWQVTTEEPAEEYTSDSNTDHQVWSAEDVVNVRKEPIAIDLEVHEESPDHRNIRQAPVNNLERTIPLPKDNLDLYYSVCGNEALHIKSLHEIQRERDVQGQILDEKQKHWEKLSDSQAGKKETTGPRSISRQSLSSNRRLISERVIEVHFDDTESLDESTMPALESIHPSTPEPPSFQQLQQLTPSTPTPLPMTYDELSTPTPLPITYDELSTPTPLPMTYDEPLVSKVTVTRLDEIDEQPAMTMIMHEQLMPNGQIINGVQDNLHNNWKATKSVVSVSTQNQNVALLQTTEVTIHETAFNQKTRHGNRKAASRGRLTRNVPACGKTLSKTKVRILPLNDKPYRKPKIELVAGSGITSTPIQNSSMRVPNTISMTQKRAPTSHRDTAAKAFSGPPSPSGSDRHIQASQFWRSHSSEADLRQRNVSGFSRLERMSDNLNGVIQPTQMASPVQYPQNIGVRDVLNFTHEEISMLSDSSLHNVKTEPVYACAGFTPDSSDDDIIWDDEIAEEAEAEPEREAPSGYDGVLNIHADDDSLSESDFILDRVDELLQQ